MWVDLQIKNLCDNDRFHFEVDIRAELGKLPRGLKETYSKIFHTILAYQDRSKLLTMRTLKWVMCARRPLSPAELIMAISVDLDNNIAQPPSLDKETILRFCNNLVIWDCELDVLRFSHLSVQEFLEETSFKIADAHSMAAETCLHVLCSSNQQTRRNRSAWTKMDGQAEPYYDEQWGHHVRICGQQSENSIITILQKEFFHSSAQPSKAYIEWATRKGLCYQAYGHPTYDIHRTPLFTAAHYGLSDSVRYLLAMDIRGAQPLNLQTALFIAASAGHEPIVHLLIDNGANPKLPDRSGNTPLHIAASGGHMSMFDNGADPSLQSGAGLHLRSESRHTALSFAARGGHESVVHLLLNNGADPNRPNRSGETALFFASSGGYEPVVQLLLDKGADPRISDNDGNTALFLAAGEGHEPVVQLLLNHGVNPNLLNKSGELALSVAARRGHNSVVQMLHNNADPNGSCNPTLLLSGTSQTSDSATNWTTQNRAMWSRADWLTPTT